MSELSEKEEKKQGIASAENETGGQHPSQTTGVEDDDFQETVALSRQELDALNAQNRQGGDDDDGFQETVALSRQELDALNAQNRQGGDDDDDFQETVALSRQELDALNAQNRQGGDDDDGFQETVALSRQELDALNAQNRQGGDDDDGFQETVALSRQKLDALNAQNRQGGDDDDGFQETVALSRQELDALNAQNRQGGDDDDGFQETVALSRQELDALNAQNRQGGDDDDGFQETVALSRQELDALNAQNRQGGDDDDGFQETVALSRQELDALNAQNRQGGDDDDGFQETVALSRQKLDALNAQNRQGGEALGEDFQETVTMSCEELEQIKQPAATALIKPAPVTDGPKRITIDPSVQAGEATQLEKAIFRQQVSKTHGDTKYHAQDNLFSGGMGTILKVIDQDLDRVLAMKVIKPKLKNNSDTLTSFIEEAKITGLLEHPNIIPVHELGLLQEVGLYFTMTLAQGEALNQILKKVKTEVPEYIEKYTFYYLFNIFRKVCDAVSFAHSKGIIHQDIKPHNIIVGPFGEVFLMDWGLAKFISQQELKTSLDRIETFGEPGKSPAKKTDLIKGSPAYMSPEQALGDPDALTVQSDIFLLGATLYHIATLAAPYCGNSMPQIINKARRRDLIYPGNRNPGRQIPEALCRIIMKAMEPKKEDRYQSAAALAKDIDDLLAGKWSQQVKKTFKAGEMLMQEGETGDEAYLIIKGSVEVVKEAGGQKVILGTLHAGDIVGEMALIKKETRSASVQAVENTEAAILTNRLVSQDLKKLPPYMEKIVSTLTDRLRTANQNIHPHISGDCTSIVLKQLRLLANDKSDNNQDKILINYDDIVEEISQDLGLPRQKVEDVFSEARQSGLIESINGKLRIKNRGALNRFGDRHITD
jgi:serine/threonine protein kinase